MPTARWLTPLNLNRPEPEPEPRGLLGFMGGGQDFGADIGDRLGVISQILMNLGSGRGGAGIAEATAAVNARSDARQQRRKAERMVGRLADKLEGSNPELAAAMRANTELGLQVLGKQMMMPFEFEQESKLAQMRGDIDYKRAVELADRKAAAEREQSQLWIEMMGGGKRTQATPTIPEQTSSSAIPTEALVPNDPNMTSLGTGEGEVQISPLSATSAVTPPSVKPNQPAPEFQIPPEYLVGLPDNPAQAESLLNLRLNWGDPDMPLEDMFQFYKAGGTENHVGFDDFKRAVAERKERRQRTAQFETRTKAFNVAPQGPSLPGDPDMPKPGQAALLQAGINPAIVPPEQQPQTAEYLKQAYRTGEKDYTAALKDLIPSDSAGLTVTTQNPDGTTTTVTTGKGGAASEGKPTEGNLKNLAFYNRGKLSIPQLLDPKNIEALRDPALEAASKVPVAGNYLTQGPYQTADSAAENFLISILRPDTGATINPEEGALYRRIFIPQPGDDDNRVAFKAALRHAALEGVRRGQTPKEVGETASDAWRQVDPTAPGAQPPPLPEWAAKEGVSPEAWAQHPELWFDEDEKEPKP